MRKHSDLDWGWMDEPHKQTHMEYSTGNVTRLNEFHKNSMVKEIFEDKMYESIYQVKEGDVVLDIGASIGPFTYSILDKNPKMVYCLEPSNNEFGTITKNLGNNPNVTLINKGITHSDCVTKSNMMFGGEGEFRGTKFSTFIKDNNIDYVDFIKTDCEGGEYHIFMDENMDFLLNNVGCIVGEWHLNTEDEMTEFRYFRDKYLKQFKTFDVFAVDGINIKWEFGKDNFDSYYNQIIFHISNK
jgi:FkbM family methyltransferase|tara:strand:- start:1494 stop:2219 length:726 start_codon:yes stop_codon:yes gene_type:complete